MYPKTVEEVEALLGPFAKLFRFNQKDEATLILAPKGFIDYDTKNKIKEILAKINAEYVQPKNPVFMVTLAIPPEKRGFKKIRVEDIEPNPHQPRKQYPNRHQLTKSMKKDGQFHNILLKLKPNGKAVTQVGHGRLESLVKDFGVKEITAMPRKDAPMAFYDLEKDLSEEDMIRRMYRENYDRNNYRPEEEAELFKAIIDFLKNEHVRFSKKKTWKQPTALDVVKFLGGPPPSQRHVEKRLNLLRFSKDIQKSIVTLGGGLGAPEEPAPHTLPVSYADEIISKFKEQPSKAEIVAQRLISSEEPVTHERVTEEIEEMKEPISRRKLPKVQRVPEKIPRIYKDIRFLTGSELARLDLDSKKVTEFFAIKSFLEDIERHIIVCPKCGNPTIPIWPCCHVPLEYAEKQLIATINIEICPFLEGKVCTATNKVPPVCRPFSDPEKYADCTIYRKEIAKRRKQLEGTPLGN